MIIDWSNRVLIDSTYKPLVCSYCKQETKYDKNNECVNCGAHRDERETSNDQDT
jgi:predicted amidophosphoribosyltransferase